MKKRLFAIFVEIGVKELQIFLNNKRDKLFFVFNRF